MIGRVRQAAARLQRALGRGPADVRSAVGEADLFRIEDGVDYRQPPVLPGDVARRDSKQISAYLTETAQSTYKGQFDQSRTSAYDGPVLMPTDDPLMEWNTSTRKLVLTNCHAAFHRNPIAKRAVELTRHFAVGRGFTVSYQNTDVQRVIEAFCANEENAVKEYEKTLLQDLQVDGEIIIRFFEEGGDVVIVPLAPWTVTDVETEPGFFRRVKRWHLDYWWQNTSDSTSGGERLEEWIPASEVLHVAINRHSYELRGRPDLFVILPWLRAYKEWLEDRVRQNKWRGALLWFVQIASALPGVIAQKAAQYRKPPTPGSVVVATDKENWTALQNNVGAGDVAEDGRQIKLMTAVGVGLPEYMLSDGENANLASSQSQQLPALWKFADAQEIMAEQVWTPIFRRVIRAKVAAGELGGQVMVQDADGDPILDSNGAEQWMDAEQAFAVTYHELQSDDPKSLAEAIQLDLLNGLVSVETAAGKRGYDYRMEKKLMQRERQEARDRNGTGETITPEGIGMGDGVPGGEATQDHESAPENEEASA